MATRLSADAAFKRAKKMRKDWADLKYVSYAELAEEYDVCLQYARNIILKKKCFRKKPPKGNYKKFKKNDAKYYVYEDGKIWSRSLNRFLEPTLDDGYYKCKAGKVHRVVLTVFDRPPKKGEECRHLDGNSLNNHISNLKWGTAKENTYDKLDHGTFVRGELVPNAKLTEKKVKKIMELWNKNTRYSARQFSRNIRDVLYKQYGIDIEGRSIHAIITGRTWTHVTGITEVVPAVQKQIKTTEPVIRRAHEHFKKSKLSALAFSKKYADYLVSKGHTIHYRIVRDALIGDTWQALHKEYYPEKYKNGKRITIHNRNK